MFSAAKERRILEPWTYLALILIFSLSLAIGVKHTSSGFVGDAAKLELCPWTYRGKIEKRGREIVLWVQNVQMLLFRGDFPIPEVALHLPTILRFLETLS